ncbi:hypothetical protein PI95_013110 [Hassallia byssoidea VB512170]|uniref:Uncharacterized protein n=1 Tax=Hassallia byssoidea VB512170 TaxID=1304833 RepID=A0A846H945_9CYAN|nr:hypothetical protein [Hassalia byssoidea]NEU73478.1 hypothetical protein [Hassalia byssoidea VB512170]
MGNGQWAMGIKRSFRIFWTIPHDGRCFKSAEPTADAPLGETPRPHCLPYTKTGQNGTALFNRSSTPHDNQRMKAVPFCLIFWNPNALPPPCPMPYAPCPLPNSL